MTVTVCSNADCVPVEMSMEDAILRQMASPISDILYCLDCGHPMVYLSRMVM